VAGSGRGQTLVDIRPDYTVAIMMATVCYVSSAFAVSLLPESSAGEFGAPVAQLRSIGKQELQL